MNLKTLIVDDEHSGRSALSILLQKYYSHLFGTIELASDLPQSISLLENNFFNLCFLDIQLSNHSGFELLPFLHPETKVVFVTAYSEYAIQAIKERAYDYILKPISPVEFRNCVDRYEVEHKNNINHKKYLLIKEHGETVPIPLSEIIYVEADGAYSVIHLLKSKKFTVSKTLKIISDSLGDDFIRIHKSYFVNKRMVKSYKKEELKTTTNTCLPVSRSGGKELSRVF